MPVYLTLAGGDPLALDGLNGDDFVRFFDTFKEFTHRLFKGDRGVGPLLNLTRSFNFDLGDQFSIIGVPNANGGVADAEWNGEEILIFYQATHQNILNPKAVVSAGRVSINNQNTHRLLLPDYKTFYDKLYYRLTNSTKTANSQMEQIWENSAGHKKQL
jgi:hypothetical protein